MIFFRKNKCVQDGSQLTAAFLIIGLFIVQSTLPAAAAKEGKQTVNKEWHVRLTIKTDDGRQDRSNILGRLKDSKPGKDSHDLPEMPPPPPPMGDRYLSIVFPHPEWKTEMPDYSSDFRSVPVGPNTDDAWKFEIRTHTPGISAELSWEGPAAVLARSRIKEAKSGRVLIEDCVAADRQSFILKKERIPLIWEYRPERGGKAGTKKIKETGGKQHEQNEERKPDA